MQGICSFENLQKYRVGFTNLIINRSLNWKLYYSHFCDKNIKTKKKGIFTYFTKFANKRENLFYVASHFI